MIQTLAILGLFLPLIGFLFAGTIGRYFQARTVYIVAASAIGLSFVLNLILLLQLNPLQPFVIELAEWIHFGSLKASWSIRLDTLSCIMLTLVGFISTGVHAYSYEYMKHDEGNVRFISYLSLFTFFMLILVCANDLLQLFVGWEGVGVASYLLIGFWYTKESANDGATKAFVVNRVGDFALIVGIAVIFVLTGSVQYDAVLAHLPAQGTILDFGVFQCDALTVMALFVFLGAMGKSAQLGLHVWLPDAMEGPTPVSALLHSATMVTAGVFLVIRLTPLFEQAPAILDMILIVGTLTALFAGTVALAQDDIKRVVAYSTCSQLGFMFVAIGASASAVAMFHLTTHAFFKSLLFLGSGSVIHAMSDNQDMQKMGGLWRELPQTHLLMLIGTLALIGTPFFSGAISKDIILEMAWAKGSATARFAFYGSLVAVLFTALYSWRLMILTFYGKKRYSAAVAKKLHESPLTMLWPLFILGLFSIFFGGFTRNIFIENGAAFFGTSLSLDAVHQGIEIIHQHAPGLHYGIVAVVALGSLLAFYIFRNGFSQALRENFESIYAFLKHKWYFDELYHIIFVQPCRCMGYLFWKKGDIGLIDRFGPNGISCMLSHVGERVRLLQSGRLNQYVSAMLLGLMGLLGLTIYFMVKG